MNRCTRAEADLLGRSGASQGVASRGRTVLCRISRAGRHGADNTARIDPVRIKSKKGDDGGHMMTNGSREEVRPNEQLTEGKIHDNKEMQADGNSV